MGLTRDVDGREVDPDVAQLYATMRERGLTTYEEVGAAAARRMVAASTKLQGPAPDLPAVSGTVGGVDVRTFRSGSGGTVIAYLHGGGWVTGDLDVADTPCRQLAEATRSDVVAIGYRRAPEHPFPTAHDDALAAVLGLRKERPDDPLVLVGDSAGGNLAATLTLRRPDVVDGLVLLYPPISPPGSEPTPSTRVNAADPILPATTMAFFWDSYRGPEPAPADGRLDPTLVAVPAGHPATFVLTCGLDVLRDEGAAYARRLAAAGVDVTHHDEPGLMHGYLWMAGLFPDQVTRTLARLDGWIARRPRD